MKSLFKIICRYSVTAGVIIFVLLLSNAAAFLFWGYKTMENDRSEKFDREAVEEIGGELSGKTTSGRLQRREWQKWKKWNASG